MYPIENEIIKLLKVLADPTRLRILLLLKDEPQYAKNLQEQLKKSQSTISNYLGILLDANLIKYGKETRRNLYTIKDREILSIINSIKRCILKEQRKKLDFLRQLEEDKT